MLRDLAERALEGLGVKDTAAFLHGEMLKQFGAIAASVGDQPGREARLARRCERRSTSTSKPVHSPTHLHGSRL